MKHMMSYKTMPKRLHLLTEAKSQSWLECEGAFSTSLSCETCSGSLNFVLLLYVLCTYIKFSIAPLCYI